MHDFAFFALFCRFWRRFAAATSAFCTVLYGEAESGHKVCGIRWIQKQRPLRRDERQVVLICGSSNGGSFILDPLKCYHGNSFPKPPFDEDLTVIYKSPS